MFIETIQRLFDSVIVLDGKIKDLCNGNLYIKTNNNYKL